MDPADGQRAFLADINPHNKLAPPSDFHSFFPALKRFDRTLLLPSLNAVMVVNDDEVDDDTVVSVPSDK